MVSTDDPEVFRERWHSYIDDMERLKQTLHPDRWDELDEPLEDLHDLVDEAADEWEEDDE